MIIIQLWLGACISAITTLFDIAILAVTIAIPMWSINYIYSRFSNRERKESE